MRSSSYSETVAGVTTTDSDIDKSTETDTVTDTEGDTPTNTEDSGQSYASRAGHERFQRRHRPRQRHDR